MKAKLLKKIRKKYSWYINSKGFPVLINHFEKTAEIIDVYFYKNYFNIKQSEEIPNLEVSEELVCYRLLLTIMLKDFGYEYKHRNYTKAFNFSKKNIKEKYDKSRYRKF